MAMTFHDLEPGDFLPTSIDGGLPKLVRIWEHLRELNWGGYGGAVLVDVKNAVSKGKSGVTSCSPFTATSIYMALDPRAFDPSQPWSLEEPYEPLFDGGKPLDINFYRLHNGFSLSSYANVKDKKFAGWKSDFKQRYVDRMPQLTNDFSAFNFINHSAGSVIALNLGQWVDPKKMRRGDMVGIDWHNGHGHATFCWNVHLDKNGDVDCFQFISSNGTSANGGAGITIFRYPDVDPAYLEKSGGRYTKKAGKHMFSGIIGDRRAYPEYIQKPYWWFGLPGVKKGDINLDTFGVPATTVQISYADSMDVSVHVVHVARLNGVTPPEPYLRADDKAPAPQEIAKPAPLTKVKSKKVGDAASPAQSQPEKAPPGAQHPVQASVEANLAILWSTRWISESPGDPKSINDANSQAALRDYQEKFMRGDVPQLGHADPKTRQRLAKTAAIAMAMPMVSAALHLAHSRGDIQAAPGTNSMQLDPATRAAVKEFQKKQGLDADGIPGPNTQERLSAYMKQAAKSTLPKEKQSKGAEPAKVLSCYFPINNGPPGKAATLNVTTTPACNGKSYSVALFQGDKQVSSGQISIADSKGSVDLQVPDGIPSGSQLVARLSGGGLVTQTAAPFHVTRDDSRYWFVDMRKHVGAKQFELNERGVSDHPLWMPDPRRDNQVQFLLEGRETYDAMARAMETAVQPGHFVYLAGWDAYDDFNLKPDDPGNEHRDRRGKKGTTLRELLQRASARGAMIRALFWFGYWIERKFGIDNYAENKRAANAINALRNGHAIMDGRIQFMGSHHQKLLLVYGSEGLIAFAGGRDFHPGRIFASGEDRSDLDPSGGKLEGPELPYLDLHVQIRGHAAYDLLEIFLRRYADHPTAGAEGHEIIALRPKPGPASAAVDPHPVTVRVCATFGNAPIPDGDTAFTPSEDVQKRLVPQTVDRDLVKIAGKSISTMSGLPHEYSFAPRGRQSGRAQLLYAISSARKFIYFEDQYMVSREIAEALKEAIHRKVKVIGVIPHQTISTDYDGAGLYGLASTRLSRVIDLIGEGEYGDHFLLFCPYRHGYPGPKTAPYQYIHSKVFIFDDAFCTIGSMNFNMRSTTNDSELSLGFYEPGPQKDGFTKRLRVHLWARHLGLEASDFDLLADPDKAIRDLWSQVDAAPPFKWTSVQMMGEQMPIKDKDGYENHWKSLDPKPIRLAGGREVMPNVLLYNWLPDEPLEKRHSSPVPWQTLAEFVDYYIDPEVSSDETRRDHLPKNDKPGP